ncbi:lipoprotein [Sporomusaceae bacterium FL31]|nr:lipoprotein [Sporomusaceae bacterium FL31]GCE34049.1 lipoprotein [Sporomusaceae bacterium]
MAIRNLVVSRKMWLYGGVFMLAVILIGSAFFLKKQDTAGKAVRAATVKPLVTVRVVRQQDMYSRLVLSGQTVSAAQIDIAPKYTGRLAAVQVELGQAVAAGQVLAVQDTREISLLIAQTAASIRQAKAEMTETKAAFDAGYLQAEADYRRQLTNYQRYESLLNTGAISREAFELVKQQMINAKTAYSVLNDQTMAGGLPAALDIKQALLDKAQYNLELQQQQRDDMILRAPQSGVIGFRQAEPGMMVQAGQKILTVVDNSGIFVDCMVSEQAAATLHTGMNLDMTVESLKRHYPGKIIYISPSSDSKTQIYTIRIVLERSDSALRSGMFAHAAVSVMLSPQTLVVPKQSLVQQNGKNYLFVINDRQQVEQRLVQTGQRSDDSVEILSGIRDGEQVAVTNISRLKPDMKVEVVVESMTEPGGSQRGGGS